MMMASPRARSSGSDAGIRTLRDLAALLKAAPPVTVSRHPEGPSLDGDDDNEKTLQIDADYKDIWQTMCSTVVNLSDLAHVPFAELSRGLELPRYAHRLRICSLGCGDGAKDFLMMQSFLLAYPNTSMEYVGVDSLQTICDEAEACMLKLDQDRLKVSMSCRDFEKDSLLDLGSFDLVNCCNVLYYFEDLSLGVDKVLSVLKKGGRAAITLVNSRGLSPLRNLLWKSEGKHKFWTSEDVKQLLDAKYVQYSAHTFPIHQDYSLTIKDEFKSPVSRAILDFACHTKMKWYSDQAVQLCIQHITDLSGSELGQFVLAHEQECITAFV